MDTVWLAPVYPQACFRLGFLLVDKGDYQGALHWLLFGGRMEPHRGLFPLEAAHAYALLGKHAEAVTCFAQAAELSGDNDRERAAALRGMGISLIDLGRLAEAEKNLRASLAADPDNPAAVAKAGDELAYIAMLRARGMG